MRHFKYLCTAPSICHRRKSHLHQTWSKTTRKNTRKTVDNSRKSISNLIAPPPVDPTPAPCNVQKLSNEIASYPLANSSFSIQSPSFEIQNSSFFRIPCGNLIGAVFIFLTVELPLNNRRVCNIKRDIAVTICKRWRFAILGVPAPDNIIDSIMLYEIFVDDYYTTYTNTVRSRYSTQLGWCFCHHVRLRIQVGSRPKGT